MIELHTTPLSANGRKVLAACIHLGLEPTVHHVNVYAGEGRRPEYLRINPSGKIPTLVDGELVLTESNAILIYLAEAHGDFRLFSRDPAERARITRWLFWEAAHWQPVLSLVLADFVGHLLLPETVPAPRTPPNWEDERLRPLLDRLERRLGERVYVASNDLSIADFCVGGMTTYFRAAGFPFGRYPNLTTWYEGLERLDAWRETAVEPWKGTGEQLADS
jgi:glutathione S-transferase